MAMKMAFNLNNKIRKIIKGWESFSRSLILMWFRNMAANLIIHSCKCKWSNKTRIKLANGCNRGLRPWSNMISIWPFTISFRTVIYKKERSISSSWMGVIRILGNWRRQMRLSMGKWKRLNRFMLLWAIDIYYEQFMTKTWLLLPWNFRIRVCECRRRRNLIRYGGAIRRALFAWGGLGGVYLWWKLSFLLPSFLPCNIIWFSGSKSLKRLI